MSIAARPGTSTPPPARPPAVPPKAPDLASVRPKAEHLFSDLSARIAELEQRFEELSRRVQLLVAVRETELGDKLKRPSMHRGHPVVGKIPIWGSGRSLIIMRTGRDRYDLDVVDD